MNKLLLVGALLLIGVGTLWLLTQGDSPIGAPPETESSATDDSLAVVAQSALEPELPPQVTDDEVRTRASPPSETLRDTPSATADFRGRVIRRSDKSPLAEFALELRDETDRKLLVITDADGRFAAPSPLALGVVQARVLDHPDRTASVWTKEFARSEWESHEVELVFEPGPTFRLAIRPDNVPVRELVVRLIFDREPNPSRLEFDPIHEGTPPWVRLPGSSMGPNGNHRLEVRSRDGLLFGSAPVSRGWGIEPNVVRIDLESRAAIAGRVVETDGTRLAGASVKLRLASTAPSAPPREAWTARDGAFQFGVLPVDRATLSASLFRYEPVDGQMVALAAGRSTAQLITMRRLLSAGSIRARVTSETGRFDSLSELALMSLADGNRGAVIESVQIEWVDESGRRVGHAELKDIPAGKYRVAGITHGDWNELRPEWTPARVEVSPPKELEFVVRDNVARADLVFRVRDAATGVAIPDFDALVKLEPFGDYESGSDRPQPILRGVPLDRRFVWRVDKLGYGYQPATGSETDFNLEEVHNGRTQRIAEVALRAGWADVVRVTERRSKEPMQGASVIVDGKLAGVTDEKGLLPLEAESAHSIPRLIEVKRDGWRTERADFTGTGRIRHSLFIEVEMSPDKSKH